jgi:hypothetical protein
MINVKGGEQAMRTTLIPVLAVSLALACAAFGAKYVDPLGGDDGNDGSMPTPWKTLANIHNLSDTVYISNSAACYFGSSHDRNPVDVTLMPWGDGPVTVVVSNNGGTAAIYMNRNPGTGNRLIVRDIVFRPALGAQSLIYPREGSGKTLDIERCTFDMSEAGPNTRTMTMRSNMVFLRFCSNLVHDVDTSTGWFVYNEQYPWHVEMRHNRFFRFGGSNAGIIYAGAAGCYGYIVNNTAWGARYFVRSTAANPGITNINNIVENKILGDNWWRGNLGDMYCDYTYSGDSEAATFDSNITQGPSNFTGLTETQLAFINTNDANSADLLKIEMSSVAAVSGADSDYPGTGAARYAGWADPIPEPLAMVLVPLAGILIRRAIG